jgi:hypothetical protein
MHEHYLERLARGGQPLVTAPLQELLPRPRRRRPVRLWRVLEVLHHTARDAAIGVALGLVSVVLVVGPVGHGMGWI